MALGGSCIGTSATLSETEVANCSERMSEFLLQQFNLEREDL